MERHRCKLCYRNFSNGKALGGHMRSHMIHLSPCSEKQDQVQETEQLGQAIHSSSSSQGEVVLPEVESDEETSDPFDGKTSKRPRKARNYLCSSNEELSSSVSDVTEEEAVARCLMMLSRDRWEEKNDENDDVSEDSSPLMKAGRGNKVKGKYKCGTCNKVFKSYQALGGHRASYKKIKADVATAHSVSPAAAAEEKVHECPFCHRVFASGQALGGHKRSHFMGNNNSNFTNFSKSKISRIGENFDMIDLNLPAPVEDGDEIIFSQQ